MLLDVAGRIVYSQIAYDLLSVMLNPLLTNLSNEPIWSYNPQTEGHR